MSSKIKNIIILAVIAIILVLAYIFFIKGSPEEENLVSSPVLGTVLPDTSAILDENSVIARDFLSVLLNVKNIKLNDTIFSDRAFVNLRDSSILLAPSGDEGRANPFAPIGFEPVTKPSAPVVPICTLPTVLDEATNTCVTPEVVCELPEVLDEATNTCITPAPAEE